MRTKEKRKLLRLVTVVLMVGSILLACSADVTEQVPSSDPSPDANQTDTQADTQVDTQPELNPFVVQTNEIGTFGGTLFAAFPQSYRHQAMQTLGFYEPLLGWDETAENRVPNTVESIYVSDDARTYRFVIREGLRWSNGDPVTSEDARFAIEDWMGNTDLNPVFPTIMQSGGEPVTINIIDERTFEYVFSESNMLFITSLTLEHIGGIRLLSPSQYLKQFHNQYAEADELERLVRDAGMENWVQLFNQRADFTLNPDLPVLYAWKLSERSADGLVATYVRNPFYFKTDTAGNQLPYIDSIQVEYVDNLETLKLKIMAGEVDYIYAPPGETFSEWPSYMQNAESGNYRLVRARGNWAHVLLIQPNNASEHPQKGPLLSNRDFRAALSMAINREELTEIIYNVADYRVEIGQQSPVRDSAFFNEEMSNQFVEFDVEQAEGILDDLGLSERGSDGFRLCPDGNPLTFQLSIPDFSQTWVDVGNIVAMYWREVGLNVEAIALDPSIWDQLVDSNEIDISIVSTGGGAMVQPNMACIDSYSIGEGGWFDLWGRAWVEYMQSDGESGVQPPSFVYEMRNLRSAVLVAQTESEQTERINDLVNKFADVFPVIGIARPLPQFLIISNNLGNTPDHYEILVHGLYGVGGHVNPSAFFIR